MTNVVTLLLGTLFGIGLQISGMTDPAIVLGFLTVSDAWNPTLAFVMGGALLVTLPGYAWVRRRKRIASGASVTFPTRWPPDRRLVVGAGIFGVGWGLAGICPGPSLVLLGEDGWRAVVFVAALALGGFLADGWAPQLRERALPDVPMETRSS